MRKDTRPQKRIGCHGKRIVGAAIDAEERDDAVGGAEEVVCGGEEGDMLEDLLGDAGEDGHGCSSRSTTSGLVGSGPYKTGAGAPENTAEIQIRPVI